MGACAKCGYDPARKPTSTWTHRVASYTPSLNDVGVNGKNAHKYRTWRKHWEKVFGPWLSKLPAAQLFRRIQITRHYGKGQRAFDRINFAAGCKPLLDTIVNHGGLYDDSVTWCEDHYSQLKSPDGKDYVQIVIEEFPGDG